MNDYFAGLFANDTLKVFSIAISIFLLVVLITQLSGIIWYERFGNDSKRTVINKLLSYMAISTLTLYTIASCLLIFRAARGIPLTGYICKPIYFASNMLTNQVILEK